MGLLDGLLGSLMGGNAGGTQGNLLSGIMTMVQQHPEGLQGLMNQFNSAGLGTQVQSWLSTGQNLPISPDQIKSALNSEQIQGLASKMGISTDDVAAHLSSILPGLVDKLTPNGQLPTGDLMDHVKTLMASLGGNK